MVVLSIFWSDVRAIQEQIYEHWDLAVARISWSHSTQLAWWKLAFGFVVGF